jgi:uncharacterized protein (TIGR03435 family)
MELFAKQLSAQVRRLVVDRTGLKGDFDFKLEWMPEQAQPMPVMQPGDSANPKVAAENAPGPSIFTALQEQLGLRLEAQRDPAEILVIDHVERALTEK